MRQIIEYLDAMVLPGQSHPPYTFVPHTRGLSAQRFLHEVSLTHRIPIRNKSWLDHIFTALPLPLPATSSHSMLHDKNPKSSTRMLQHLDSLLPQRTSFVS